MGSAFSISVVIATHAREEYLEETIKCALAQDLPPVEVFVVSDVQDEGTRRVVQACGEISSIPVILVEWNAQPSLPRGSRAPISRNMGVYRAKGDWIACSDDDDTWDKNYLSRATAFAQEGGHDGVITHIYTDRSDHSGGKRVEAISPGILMTRNPGLIGSNLLVKRDTLLAIGGYNPMVVGSADKEVAIRLLHSGASIGILREPLVYYRVHQGQGSNGAARRIVNRKALYRYYCRNVPFWVRMRMHWNLLYWRWKRFNEPNDN